MSCPWCGAPSMELSERLTARRAQLGLGCRPLPCPPHALRLLAESLFGEEDDSSDATASDQEAS